VSGKRWSFDFTRGKVGAFCTGWIKHLTRYLTHQGLDNGQINAAQEQVNAAKEAFLAKLGQDGYSVAPTLDL